MVPAASRQVLARWRVWLLEVRRLEAALPRLSGVHPRAAVVALEGQNLLRRLAQFGRLAACADLGSSSPKTLPVHERVELLQQFRGLDLSGGLVGGWKGRMIVHTESARASPGPSGDADTKEYHYAPGWKR